MALSRCGVVFIAGLLCAAPCMTGAQQPQSTSPPAVSYDQMLAEQQAAQVAKDAAAAKHSKKDKQAQDQPASGSTPAPAAASSDAPAADPAAAIAGGDVPPIKDPNAPAAKPVKYDKKGRPIQEKVKKEKPPKLIPVDIVHGELTVDGLIAKAGLNFQILDLHFFYIWVPGLGTAVISNQPFPGSKIQLDALDGNTLTVKVDGHQLQLACDRDMLDTGKRGDKDAAKVDKELAKGEKPTAKRGKSDKPTNMFVALDTTYQRGSNYPEFGWGDLAKAPYSWPGTLADLNPNTKAPPLPDNLKQKKNIIKMCSKNADGTQGPCHDVEVPLVLGKNATT